MMVQYAATLLAKQAQHPRPEGGIALLPYPAIHNIKIAHRGWFEWSRIMVHFNLWVTSAINPSIILAIALSDNPR